MLSCFSNRSIVRISNIPPLRLLTPILNKTPKICKTPDEAVSCIKSHDRVFMHCCAQSPVPFLDALARRAPELEGVEMVSSLMSYTKPLMAKDPVIRKAFRPSMFFLSRDEQPVMREGNPHVSYIPTALSDIPFIMKSPDFPIAAALLFVSPPDKHGYCSLGTSLTVGRPGADYAKVLIAEISPHVPRTLGNTFVHFSHLDYVWYSNRHPIETPPPPIKPEQEVIGKKVAELIEDGDCLQLGVGAVPNVVMKALRHHKNLGVHSEMVPEGLVDLIQCGAVNNSMKGSFVGKVLANFVSGTKKLYNFVDNNPVFYFDSAELVNSPRLCAKNPHFKAINSAIEIDITGQVCADSIGVFQYSGCGGQLDFVRGASMSEGGRAIIAMESTTMKKIGNTKQKVSKIVSHLKSGASVTTIGAYSPTIVTEYGVADLWGLTMRQRVQKMIKIAHPMFRDQLAKDAEKMLGGKFCV